MSESQKPDSPNPKAPDPVVCPHCRNNHLVFVDRQRTNQSGIIRSWVLDYFVCERCEQKFYNLGAPILVSGAYAIGAVLLFIAHVTQTL